MKRAIAVAVLLLIVAVATVAGRGAAGNRLPNGTVADRIVVDKSDRTLVLYRQNRKLKTYKVTFGRQPAGAKSRQGDDRTPEGSYRIDRRNLNSRYHLALHVSYPSPEDIRRARAGGYAPGGDIMIHGLRRGFGWIGSLHRSINWTHGCIAVTNDEIEEIAQVVPNGTPIQIQP